MTDKRVPITLLTGFLGAGKTTLLNQLIRDPSAGRIAVIMNEFGDVGLDHDLIEEATEETVLLQSGCLCCAVLGDLAETLGALAARRDAGELAFDRVVIETSGIADPRTDPSHTGDGSGRGSDLSVGWRGDARRCCHGCQDTGSAV